MRAVLLILLLVIPLGFLPSAVVADGPRTLATYTGAGTIVVSGGAAGATSTFVDNGAVTCGGARGDGTYQTGTGGVCLLWSQLAYDQASNGYGVGVTDASAGQNVAFQVCIDTNGDGVCGGQGGGTGVGVPPLPTGGKCSDIIFFSHGNDGSFHNPLFVPAAARDYMNACGSAKFDGVVVILCAGEHGAGTPGAHTHVVTSGSVFTAAPADLGHGNFCGAPTAAKAYVIT